VCPAGKAPFTKGVDECVECPLGKFSLQDSIEECVPCGIGNTSNPRQDGCEARDM
jgi:hypothetical protein